MKKIVFFISTLAFFLASCTQNKTPEFDHYGVYLQNGDEYIELKEGDEINLPEVIVEGDVVLYVYSPAAITHAYMLRQNREIEYELAPVDVNDEMVKLTSEVFGGKILLRIRGDIYENYPFMVENKNIKESLKNWMQKVIDDFEQENFAALIEITIPDSERSRISPAEIEQIIQGMKSNPLQMQRFINQMKIDMKKLDNEEEVILKPATSEICIGTSCYRHWGNGRWG